MKEYPMPETAAEWLACLPLPLARLALRRLLDCDRREAPVAKANFLDALHGILWYGTPEYDLWIGVAREVSSGGALWMLWEHQGLPALKHADLGEEMLRSITEVELDPREISPRARELLFYDAPLPKQYIPGFTRPVRRIQRRVAL